MPSPTTDGVSSTSDYEELGYDAAGNVTSMRNRAGESIALTYDALGRPTFKNLPGSEPDVSYTYDLLGRLTGASTSSQTFTFTHDALGRQLTESGPLGTTTSGYDLGGRRTSLAYPDGFVATYSYLVTDEMATLGQSGVGTLVTLGYDGLGRRTSLTRANGAGTAYGYDAVSRLSSLSHDLAGTSRDVTFGYGYNPAGQIVTRTSSNDAYSYTALANANVTDTHNGLNQLTAFGSGSDGHDTRGNTTSDPGNGQYYGYSSENLLTTTGVSGVWTGTLTYDPLTRLRDSGTSARIQVLHDGDQRVAELNAMLLPSRSRRLVTLPAAS